MAKKRQSPERKRREIIAAICQLSEQTHWDRPYRDRTPAKIKYVRSRLHELRSQLKEL